MTLKAKKQFIRSVLNEYTRRFRITADIKVKFPKGADEDSDAAINPPYLNLEEGVVTTLERAFVGQELWERIDKLSEGSTVAYIDSSNGEYHKFIIEFYPALMELDGKEFEDLATATTVHELLHVVLFPLSAYARSLESGAVGS